ncbi:hypothetical protein C1646_725869 [Rhizophagus diaphanus]|nr:hypothetical protein C1646_725869 [Rhizophagus diaphanus] [Rhizophagus sp. MUCL 43196]
MHGISKSLYIIKRVFYVKEHIIYWPSFFKEEYENDKKHNSLESINSCLQDELKLGTITIYFNFISFYANEFVQDLDFFQQLRKPVIPFAELRLQQLTSYIEFNRNSSNFGSLENLIIQLRFNPEDFYVIFRLAFEAAYNKFAVHIPNHPARHLFYSCQVFDPKYIYNGDISQKDIWQYNAIHEFANPPDELLREWGIYCGLGNNEVLGEIELNQYWLNKAIQLPILFKIALEYIWLPVSSCILASDR